MPWRARPVTMREPRVVHLDRPFRDDIAPEGSRLIHQHGGIWFDSNSSHRRRVIPPFEPVDRTPVTIRLVRSRPKKEAAAAAISLLDSAGRPRAFDSGWRSSPPHCLSGERLYHFALGWNYDKKIMARMEFLARRFGRAGRPPPWGGQVSRHGDKSRALAWCEDRRGRWLCTADQATAEGRCSRDGAPRARL